MEVSFLKQGAVYVAEFEVPGDFNLHLERKKGGIISIYQRGSSQGEYDLSYTSFADDVFDHDFGALVYPKWIKVESSSEVVSASVNFNEGGGSGNGSGSGGGVKYYDCENSPIRDSITGFCVLAKRLFENEIKIGTLYTLDGSNYNTPNLAVSIDFNLEICEVGKVETIREQMETLFGMSVEEAFAQYGITEITKEQFYNLEA